MDSAVSAACGVRARTVKNRRRSGRSASSWSGEEEEEEAEETQRLFLLFFAANQLGVWRESDDDARRPIARIEPRRPRNAASQWRCEAAAFEAIMMRAQPESLALLGERWCTTE